MARINKATQAKRNRERDKAEKREEKRLKKIQRNAEKKLKVEDSTVRDF